MKVLSRGSIVFVALLMLSVPVILLGSGNADAGKSMFNRKCVACHGPNGEGKAAIAKMMKVEMKHLGSKEVQGLSDAELKKVITEGTGKMRPVRGLTDEEVANVIAYVRTLKEKK